MGRISGDIFFYDGRLGNMTITAKLGLPVFKIDFIISKKLRLPSNQLKKF